MSYTCTVHLLVGNQQHTWSHGSFSMSTRTRISSGTAIDGWVSFSWIATCNDAQHKHRRFAHKFRSCDLQFWPWPDDPDTQTWPACFRSRHSKFGAEQETQDLFFLPWPWTNDLATWTWPEDSTHQKQTF